MTQQSERAAASHPPAEEASAYSPSEARDALPYQPQEQAPSTHLATPRQPLGQVNSLLHNTIHLRPRLTLNSHTDLRLRPTLPHQNPRLPRRRPQTILTRKPRPPTNNPRKLRLKHRHTLPIQIHTKRNTPSFHMILRDILQTSRHSQPILLQRLQIQQARQDPIRRRIVIIMNPRTRRLPCKTRPMLLHLPQQQRITHRTTNHSPPRFLHRLLKNHRTIDRNKKHLACPTTPSQMRDKIGQRTILQRTVTFFVHYYHTIRVTIKGNTRLSPRLPNHLRQQSKTLPLRFRATPRKPSIRNRIHRRQQTTSIPIDQFRKTTSSPIPRIKNHFPSPRQTNPSDHLQILIRLQKLKLLARTYWSALPRSI